MKRVFSSHSEVCHVWAQQTQSAGRASSIFFRDSMIFSYGEHYLAAKIHKGNRGKFALVNSHNYSKSTAKHLCRIRGALRGLMPQFSSPDCKDTKAAIAYNDGAAKGRIDLALRRMKIQNEDSIKYEFESIHSAYKEASELRKLLGRKEIWPDKKELDKVQAHLSKRLARYHELNTPEMIERRKHGAERRAELAEKKELERLAESTQDFRNGLQVYGLDRLRFELLRVVGDDVQTSRGARVPVREARILLRAIQAGKDVLGQRIGSYTVISKTQRLNGDTAIKIGCHSILLSEALQVLAE